MNRQRANAFTLVELLVVVAIVAALSVTGFTAWRYMIKSSRKSQSMQNLRQLVIANQTYAAEHENFFCPAQDRRNRIRWHGGRSASSGAFDPQLGFLSPYMGDGKTLETCPQFRQFLPEGSSFESNAGGYGYNAFYVGGTPGNAYAGASAGDVSAKTVMFATTAFAKSNGVQEYPFCEPFYAPLRNGRMGSALQPSVHFRFDGRALVAWCSGKVTEEKMESYEGHDYYGGDSTKNQIGWFGPREDNGYWNPFSPAGAGKTQAPQ